MGSTVHYSRKYVFKEFAKRQLHRYGYPELAAKTVGTTVAVVTQSSVLTSTSNLTYAMAAGAYAGSIAETLAFYSVMIPRAIILDRRKLMAEGRHYGKRDLTHTLKHLVAEFGPAEIFDAFLTRPLILSPGQYLSGESTLVNAITTPISMVVADVLFYGWPVLYREKVKPWLEKRK